jgi:DNA-directed RNA polymerase subunit RPC12/RpoP
MDKPNPLIEGIQLVHLRLADFKAKAKEFYFQVLLSAYSCPRCGRDLHMTGTGDCSCPHGHRLDPTLTFQKSPCCQAKLQKQILHYRCSKCGAVTLSKFVFDERVFDAEYFRERMQEYRERARRQKDKRKNLLAESRSNRLTLEEPVLLDRLPGLIDDLDNFIASRQVTLPEFSGNQYSYDMGAYKTHIQANIPGYQILFSQIPSRIANRRLDTVWRFMTLLFMDQAREIDLSQYDQDIMIRRISNELD